MPEKRTRPAQDPKFDEARDHLMNAHDNLRKITEAWIPVEVRENKKAARKEFLLGLRSLLDVAIDHYEKTAKP